MTATSERPGSTKQCLGCGARLAITTKKNSHRPASTSDSDHPWTCKTQDRERVTALTPGLTLPLQWLL